LLRRFAPRNDVIDRATKCARAFVGDPASKLVRVGDRRKSEPADQPVILGKTGHGFSAAERIDAP
jgi:hypothetical protein